MFPSPLLRSFVLVVLSTFGLVASGCPGTGDSGGDEPSADWTFVSGVLAANCSPCHTQAPGDPPADPMTALDDPAAAYDFLVEHPAAQAPSLSRVAPGDIDGSYLIHKLRGTQGDVGGGGERMPFGGPYLDDETIDAIAEWVEAGAVEEEVVGDDDDTVGDDDDTGDDDDDDDTGDDDDDDDAVPTFSDVFTTIISPRCSCHSGASHSTGFAFEGDQATAYSVLVSVSAFEAPALSRIEPGDSANSYLQHKIDGTQASVGGSGGQMPLSGGPLDPSERDLVRAWIDAGALNN